MDRYNSCNEKRTLLNAEEYGVMPGNIDNAKAIKYAIEEAKKASNCGEEKVTLRFQPGEYHIYPDYAQQREYHTSNTNSIEYPIKTIAILIENMKDFTLDGQGALFLIHGEMMALAVVKSQNITLRNFAWDFAVPTVTEMKVCNIDQGSNTTTYEISNCFPFEISENKVVWNSGKSPYTNKYYWQQKNVHQQKNGQDSWTSVYYNSQKGILHRVAPDADNNPFLGTIKRIDKNTITVTSKKPRPKVENIGGVWGFCATPTRTTAGAFNWESKNVFIDNVRVHFMHGFGWLSQMSENIAYENCGFVPRLNSGHVITSFADLIHVSGGKGTLTVKNCTLSFSLDDHINIHGTFTRVDKRIDDYTLKLSYVHNQQGGFPQYYEGNKVQFASREGLIPLPNENAFYTVEKVVNPWQNGNDGRTMQVTFKEMLPQDLEQPQKYVAENVTYTMSAKICGNRFSTIPTRSILCTTRKEVIIENNVFMNIAMPSIFLSNDSYDWYESGPIHNLTIRKNLFYTRDSGLDALCAVIYIHPETGKLPDVNHAVHKNITIEDNTFYNEKSDAAMIHAESVKNLKICRNHFFRQQIGKSDMNNYASTMNFIQCNSVQIQNNEYNENHEPTFYVENCESFINEDSAD